MAGHSMNEELTELLLEVARRTSLDPDFRRLALSEPQKAIQQVNTRSLPVNLDVVFLDNSGTTWFYPLPDPVAGMEELSDEELELIVGGAGTVLSASSDDFYITGNTAVARASTTATGAWHR